MHSPTSRVGLSIDSGSESCSSDLSDSAVSWSQAEDLERPMIPATVSLDTGCRPLDDPLFHPPCTSLTLSGDSFEGSEPSDPVTMPRTPIRSRMHHEERRSHDIIEWSDDVRIARHPRAPSVRFCLTLFTVTLVLLSLGNNTGSETADPADSFLFYYSRTDSPVGSAAQGTSKSEPSYPNEQVSDPRVVENRQEPIPEPSSTKSAPSATTPSDVSMSGGVSSPPFSSAGQELSSKRRSNFAMARSREERPMFEMKVAGPSIVTQEGDTVKQAPHQNQTHRLLSDVSNNLSSWFAAIALLAMLIETSYKEYRRCRLDSSLEQQRRL